MTIEEIKSKLEYLRQEYKNALPKKREAIYFKALPLKILLKKKVAEEERKKGGQIGL